MVKSKKSKKDNKGEEADTNSEFVGNDETVETVASKMKEEKKGRKKGSVSGEDVSDTLNDDSPKDGETSQVKESAKKSKKKKATKKAGSDDDDEIDIIAAAVKSKQSLDDGEEISMTASKSKKSKKGKSKLIEINEEDDQPISNKTEKQQRQSVFELLDVEEPDDMDVNADSDSDNHTQTEERASLSSEILKMRKSAEDEEMAKEGQKLKKEERVGKKNKKKKKEDDDEDDIDKMLAELELEYKGEKPNKNEKTEGKNKKDDHQNMETTGIEVEEKKKKKKKNRAAENVERAEVDQDIDDVERAKLDDEDGDIEEGRTVKTAAQKKKEKKERERQKKLSQKASEKAKQERSAQEETSDKPTQQLEIPSSVDVATEANKEIIADNEEDDQEGDDTKKKKDKKKKKQPQEKDKDKEEKDKKRPGKRQLLLMQEALKKIKEEEEKQRLEEEAKIQAAEEAERLRLEKIQIEKEKKERRKLKEKERKERLKAEGKLLTKTQKQQKARAAATLEALKAHGFDVPSIGEKKEKMSRLGTRVRPNKNKKNQQETNEELKGGSEPTSPMTDEEKKISDDGLLEDEVEENFLEKESDEEEDEDIKDAWDASSGSESDLQAEENNKKIEICIKEDRKKKSKAVAPNDNENKSSSSSVSSEGDSSDEDDDDDEESESESDSEESEDSSEDERTSAAFNLRQRAIERIQKRRDEAEKHRCVDTLRSPIVCVLGHVDTGKTKILDKIRHTHVQDSEAGGITQQIGATMVPVYAIKEQAKMVKNFVSLEIKLPGLLIIDTPGHESFSNLRSRGSSLCDIAVLVVDIMHGLEPQTIESINLLKQKKTPFIVALNKIDRLYDWKITKNKDIRDAIKSQNRNTQMEFDQKLKEVIVQFAEQSLNAALFYDNKDARTYVSMVPTSASTGEGMGNLLALVVELTQNMLTKRLAYSDELQATVLELKAIPGLGTTIDVILVNGRLKEGDTVVLAGMDGPVVTQIRSLLMPQPLKELRVKNPYEEFKEIQAAQGVKITAKDLDKVIAGLNLLVAHHPDEVEILKEEVSRELHAAMSSIKLAERGVYVQASTLGSLEALLEFLRSSKIPYSGIRIGPVVKRDVMKASIMLEHDSQYAVILAFDVKIERDAQDLADSLGVKIFSADIIYHLFDRFIEYRERLKQQKRDEFKHVAVFPCKLRILPQFIFNSRDPIVLGVSVEAGVVKEGTPLSVPTKEALEIGIVTTIEINHKTIDSARKGQEVCIKIEPIPGESPKMFGRHFDQTDMLVSKITRQSIDACKEYFRDDLSKADWQLMIELKKLFQIL